MATIQVRDIPDDVYAEIRRQAGAAGQSLQSFMREQVVQDTRRRMRRAAILEEWARELDEHPGAVTHDEVVRTLREVREERDEQLGG